jgi:hypothetical protein
LIVALSTDAEYAKDYPLETAEEDRRLGKTAQKYRALPCSATQLS